MKTDYGKTKISNTQMWIIVIASNTAFGHFVYVHLAILYAGRNAWISLILGALIGLGIVVVHLKMALDSKGSLIDHALTVYGKWIGRLVGAIYVLFFLVAVSVTIKVVSDFMGIIYPTTPPSVFLLAEFSIVAWVVYAGIEVMGRTMQVLLPVMMLLGLLASVLSTPDKDFTQILPVFHSGWKPILMGTLAFAAMFSELIGFSVITEHASEPKKLPHQTKFFILIMLVMFLSPVTGPIMVFGEDLAKNLAFPTYTEIQYIRISNIIERLDIVGVMLWTIGSFFRITMFTFAAIKGVSKLFNAPRENSYVIPIILIAAAMSLSLMRSSREELYYFLASYYIYLAVAIGFGLPVLTGVVSWTRRKMKVQSSR